MKTQKGLREVHRSSQLLRHLNYRALKAELRRLLQLVESGSLNRAAAAELFERQLAAEVAEVGRVWRCCLWDLEQLVEAFFASSREALGGDGDALSGPDGPLRLLEPLRLWLPAAALADALCRHRLQQLAAVARAEGKFLALFSGETLPRGGAALLEDSPLCGGAIRHLRLRLQVAGDALLQLGLGAPSVGGHEEECAARDLPALGAESEASESSESEAPESLGAPESLLERLGRGLGGDGHGLAAVAALLGLNAEPEAAEEAEEEAFVSPIRRSPSLLKRQACEGEGAP